MKKRRADMIHLHSKFTSRLYHRFILFQYYTNYCRGILYIDAVIKGFFLPGRLDEHDPENEFQEWLSVQFSKLFSLTENNTIPNSKYIEYGFKKMGSNFDYPTNNHSDE